jgi:hypothetical protein
MARLTIWSRAEISVTWPKISHNPSGATKKQDKFVTTETIIAVASSPPALRVQTAADASVLGTSEVTIKPPAISGDSSHNDGKASNGTKNVLIPIPTSAGPGLRMLCAIESAFSVSPIKNSTKAVIDDRKTAISDNGRTQSVNPNPIARLTINAGKNHCRENSFHTPQIT